MTIRETFLAAGQHRTWIAGSRVARHILLVIHDFSLGGSERILIQLGNSWARQGRRITIVCGSEQGPMRAMVAPEVAVMAVVPPIAQGRFSRAYLGRAAAGLAKSLDVDVIVGPGNFHLTVLAAMGDVGIPKVCKISNPLQRAGRGPWASAVFRHSIGRIIGRLDAIVAMSPALLEEAERFLPLRRAHIAYEPLVPENWAWRQHAPTKGPLRLIFAGRLVAQKRVDRALRALAQLAPGEATLDIYGEGPRRRSLERLVDELGLADRVRFRGTVPDIGAALTGADMLLLPSGFEGYPAVLIEALAAGVPVVTTNCSPALKEIMLDPSFGVVADADPRTFAAAIRAVARTGRPERRAIERLVERHRIGSASDAWLSCLDAVVLSARPAVSDVSVGVPQPQHHCMPALQG